MAEVTITLFDTENGSVQMDVKYSEEFNSESNAHRFAVVLLKMADGVAENLGMPQDAATLEELKGEHEKISASQPSA